MLGSVYDELYSYADEIEGCIEKEDADDRVELWQWLYDTLFPEGRPLEKKETTATTAIKVKG